MCVRGWGVGGEGEGEGGVLTTEYVYLKGYNIRGMKYLKLCKENAIP